jgi:spermidine/putrescine transport system substrate-binding protein
VRDRSGVTVERRRRRGDAGTVNWSNWPLYLDTAEDDENSYPTLAAFEQESGLEVNYTEDINSNGEFFGKISPQLEAGQSTGRDLVVLTDWMAGRMISLGYAMELDKANIPNAENLISSYQDLDFDPGRAYSLPWQSGLTGIGYSPEKLGREITELDDLFEADLKGRITMLSEMRDTMGLLLLSMGKMPEDHTFADYQAAIAKLQGLVDDGWIRSFTGNDYAADLASGNIGAAVGWSGDVLQLQADDPGMQFVVPGAGGILWSDNLLVPKGAANKAGAEAVIDHYYDPAVAAEVAAWVNYVTPVDGAQEAMAEIDPTSPRTSSSSRPRRRSTSLHASSRSRRPRSGSTRTCSRRSSVPDAARGPRATSAARAAQDRSATSSRSTTST